MTSRVGEGYVPTVKARIIEREREAQENGISEMSNEYEERCDTNNPSVFSFRGYARRGITGKEYGIPRGLGAKRRQSSNNELPRQDS